VEDFAHQTRYYAHLVSEVEAVAHQTASQRKNAARIDCRNLILRREGHYRGSKQRSNNKGTGAAFDDCRKSILKFIVAGTFYDNDLASQRTGRRSQGLALFFER
jgi:hypothetical protein